MLSDIEIARASNPKPIEEIAEKLGIRQSGLIPYGRHIAKVSTGETDRLRQSGRRGRLVLVTAVNPTPAGEGKTTTSVGLGDGLARLGPENRRGAQGAVAGPGVRREGRRGRRRICAGRADGAAEPAFHGRHPRGHRREQSALRNAGQPYLPGQRAGHRSRVDFLAARHGHERPAAAKIECGLGKGNGVPRFDGFDITAASEVMAALCLASDLPDLKERLGRIVVARDASGKPVTAEMLRAQGSMAVLLKDAAAAEPRADARGHAGVRARRPVRQHRARLQQHHRHENGAFLGGLGRHGGGVRRGPRRGEIPRHQVPRGGALALAVVVVATVRALKYHGGVPKEELKTPDVEAVRRGMCNLLLHIRNLKGLGPARRRVAEPVRRATRRKNFKPSWTAARPKARRQACSPPGPDGGAGRRGAGEGGR